MAHSAALQAVLTGVAFALLAPPAAASAASLHLARDGDRVHLTATGQVALADRAARALGAPLPSQTVVEPPAPDGWYRWHYAKRALRERAAIARARAERRLVRHRVEQVDTR